MGAEAGTSKNGKYILRQHITRHWSVCSAETGVVVNINGVWLTMLTEAEAKLLMTELERLDEEKRLSTTQ